MAGSIPQRLQTVNGDEDPFVVANEFAEVLIRRVTTHNGIRLEVSSPRLHRAVRLDPLQLEALTWQDAAAYSEMLSEPFGPSEHEAAKDSVAVRVTADQVTLSRHRNGNRSQ